jgi:hypothetical protein
MAVGFPKTSLISDSFAGSFIDFPLSKLRIAIPSRTSNNANSPFSTITVHLPVSNHFTVPRSGVCNVSVGSPQRFSNSSRVIDDTRSQFPSPNNNSTLLGEGLFIVIISTLPVPKNRMVPYLVILCPTRSQDAEIIVTQMAPHKISNVRRFIMECPILVVTAPALQATAALSSRY